MASPCPLGGKLRPLFLSPHFSTQGVCDGRFSGELGQTVEGLAPKWGLPYPILGRKLLRTQKHSRSGGAIGAFSLLTRGHGRSLPGFLPTWKLPKDRASPVPEQGPSALMHRELAWEAFKQISPPPSPRF